MSPAKVIMPINNPRTAAELRNHGAEVIEVDMTECIKERGKLHCAVHRLVSEGEPYLKEREAACHNLRTLPSGEKELI